MIIWNGLGILVVVFTVGIGYFVQQHNPGAWKASDTPFAMTLMASGILSGVVGFFLRRLSGRTLVDPATGDEVELRTSHSLFFIPMVFWGPILIVWAIVLLVRGA